MKKIIFFVCAFMCAHITVAQNEFVATLTHDQVNSAFYGHDALKSALEKAEDGDIINLSAGTFYAPSTISKAVTLQGAGMYGGAGKETVISSNFYINMAGDDSHRFSAEGIHFSGTITFQNAINPYFIKCLFYTITYDNTACDVANAMLINCVVRNGLYIGGFGSFEITCVNSFVGWFKNYATTSKAYFQNCIVFAKEGNDVVTTTFYNCIVPMYYYYSSTTLYTSLPASCTAYNTLFFNFAYSSYGTCYVNISAASGANNWALTGNQFSALFKSLSCSKETDVSNLYGESVVYALLPKAAQQYLGTDSTQIGMQGGAFPYNYIPTYPRITKFNAASSADEEGKLKVDIEVTKAE